MTNSNNELTITSFLATIEDAPDGSGDGILTFPPEFIEQYGWKEGDRVDISLENDTIVIRHLGNKENDRTDSN